MGASIAARTAGSSSSSKACCSTARAASRQGPSAVPVVEGEQQLRLRHELGGAQTAESEQGRVLRQMQTPQPESALAEIALADSQRVERRCRGDDPVVHR